MSKVVALEIAPHAIRAAEVTGYTSKKPKLLRTGELKLEDGVAGESLVYDKEALAAALKRLWAESKFSTKSVGLLVSGRRFIVRPHTTAQTSPEILKNVLPFEAPNALPETDDLIFDFYPTHEVETKAGWRTEGLVISSPSEPISELAFAISKAKLELEYVDFTPIAVSRWLLHNRDEQNYGLVNIRDESTDIAVVEDGMPRSVRVVSKGLSSSRRKFGKQQLADASPLLRRDVLGENGVKVLAQDISMTIRTQEDEISSKLECIFTSGPRADDPELKAILQSTFGIPIIPLQIESLSEVEDEEQNLKPSFDEFVAMCGGMR